MIQFVPVRWCQDALSVVVTLAVLAPHAGAQDSQIQQLAGDYFGLAQLGVVNPAPEGIVLSIDIQNARRSWEF